MNESAIKFVQDQIAQAPHRLRGHVSDPSGKAYPQRDIYVRLEKHLNDFLAGNTEQRWIIVPGLRGVGKTTVLSQLFLKLFSRYDSVRMLYVSLDEVTGLLGSNLKDTLDAYENILGQSFERLTEPIFIFVDEVQYDPKWGLALKSLYDRSKKIFICCTGSSAVSLQTNPDVFRRTLWEKLYPLSFPEYQMIHRALFPIPQLKKRLHEALYFASQAREAHERLRSIESEVLQYWSRVDKFDVQNYLKYGSLPFALQYTHPSQAYEAVNGLLDKIIQKDIESLKSFDLRTLHSMRRVLFLLAGSQDLLSARKLLNLVELDSLTTVQRILQVLEQAEVLIRVMPYGSQKGKTTKASKYLFMSPAIRMALLGLVGNEATYHTRLGLLMEDSAALQFHREFIGNGTGNLVYEAAQGNADFILQIADRRQLAVEIGTGNKDSSQLEATMKSRKCDYGILIHEGALGSHERKNILYVPLQFFLLS
ncbi:MAG TPA: hypothetical protein DF383_13630 [Deltaproteobacteria bacterium]|nr:hypothetical protein [Deltaproteobacteria bacterium]